MQDLIMAAYIDLARDIVFRAIKDNYQTPLEICSCGRANAVCVENFFNGDLFEGLCELGFGRKYDFRKTSQRTKTI